MWLLCDSHHFLNTSTAHRCPDSRVPTPTTVAQRLRDLFPFHSLTPSLLPVTPFIPDLPSENDLGYLGYLGYFGYFHIYPIYPKYPISPYAILHSLFWYCPCVTRTISVDCTSLSIHFSIVLTLTPRTSACFTASCLVKQSFESVDEIRSPQEASRSKNRSNVCEIRTAFGSRCDQFRQEQHPYILLLLHVRSAHIMIINYVGLFTIHVGQRIPHKVCDYKYYATQWL